MYKLTAFLFFTICCHVAIFAQPGKLTGSVKDTSNKAGIQNAVVMLLTPKDSILYTFSRTDINGHFIFNNAESGNYILMTTHPIFGDYIDNIEIKENGSNPIMIPLTSKSKLLETVIIKSGAAIKMRGDTTSYTADSFKVSANANVEELLKKLPGIQVDKNGQIKAMGEKVEKVLVDGEEFFGDDPGMAVKNLRADAVKEVQVFDKKSDQAEFTGIDDGKTNKTINLKLKENKKKGYFGKIELAGGLQNKIDNHYNSNAMHSAFKGKRKLSGYLLQGNTGQNKLNWQDQKKFGSDDDITTTFDEEGGGMMLMRSNNSDEDPYIDTRNGFFENLNTGVQYTNKWNDNHTLNFSPKFNRLQYNNTKNIFSQFQLGDSLFNTNARENSFIYKRNIKNNLVYDFKIDPANSLKITTKLNIYNTKSKIYRQSENISKTKLLNNLSDNSSDNNTDKTAFSSSFLFKHKFKKDRRTFSINMDLNILNSDNTGYLYAINKYFDAGNLKQIDTLNQKKNNDNSNKTLSAKAVYTEPLSKKYALEINHEIVRTSRTNNLRTFTSTSNNSNKYDELIDSLTNNFDQQVTINKSGFKISYKHKKVRYSIGNTIGFTHFDLKDITNKKEYKQDFTNIFPSANFQYAYKPNHNFKINYSGRTIQPTISQLQQLRNNNDPLNEFIGNPFLKQSFNHGINLSNISYNFLKEMWVYQSINADVTDNAITNSVIIDKSGKTITQPINMQGSNISVSGWMGAGKKIKKLSLDLNTILQFNYSKFNELINNIKNNNKNASITFGLGIGKTKEKKYDISIQNDLGFNTNRSSIYGKTLQYYTNSLNLSGSAYIKKAWRISTDYELNYREKTDEFSNSVNNNLWNAKLEKTFKNDEFTVFTSINDILNQNIGIDRNFYGNKLTEVRNERLQRFWLVGIRWDFKNKKQTK